MIQRHPVKSSAIVAIGHEGDELHLEFKGGKVYRYKGVTAKHLDALLGAESIGKHVREHILGKFEHELLPPAPTEDLDEQ